MNVILNQLVRGEKMLKPKYDGFLWGDFIYFCSTLEIDIEKEEYTNATTDALGRNQLCDVPLLWEAFRAGAQFATGKEV